MAEVKSDMVADLKKNKFSTLQSDLSDDDVLCVWENVSEFIEKQLGNNKGVSIPGLGTFTFSQKKIDIGHNKFILIQRPVFVLSEKFIQTHQLNYSKPHVTGQIPVVPLNFASVSFEGPFNRDIVETCVKEVIQTLSRSIATRRNVEFTFQGIGRLQIRDGKVKMKFFKDFLNSLDTSGDLVNALKDRPGTVDSVMSDRPYSRAPSANTLIFPRLGDDVSKPTMPAITEEGEQIETKHQEGVKKDNEVEQKVGSRTASRIAAPISKAGVFSFIEDIVPEVIKTPKPPGSRAVSSLSDMPMMRRSLSPLQDKPDTSCLITPDRLQLSKSVDEIVLQKPMYKVPTPPIEKRPASATSSCGHANAGQELCYLCHQRERRNIPVSFTDERKRRQEEEDQLLHQFQHMKDMEKLLEEQNKVLAKRHENQKMAAYNMGASEAQKNVKTSKDPNFYPSYVFQKRPLTPPRFAKQRKYLNELDEQVTQKEDSQQKHRADEEFLERLEQVQLAEDLALQRAEYVQGRVEQTEQYKTALSAQIRYKPLQVPARVPDSDGPVFGKNDLNAEKIFERRRLAYNVYQQQLNTVEARKRASILNRLSEQKQDEDMIKRSKHEVLEDRALRYERQVNKRLDLEDDWKRALEKKKARQADERFRIQSADELMHEQCDKYKRCGQCRKKMNNCGESNIWRDTRYIPGTRIMV